MDANVANAEEILLEESSLTAASVYTAEEIGIEKSAVAPDPFGSGPMRRPCPLRKQEACRDGRPGRASV